jgi:transcriptional antiterminator NusG
MDTTAHAKEEKQKEEKQEEPVLEASQDDAVVEEKKETAHPASDKGKWYIIHTYAGHENKVERSLKQRVESMKFTDRVFDIIVPTRNTIKVSQGKKETVKEKIFPGYVLVKMILDDETWIMVRSTPGVTSFIGAGNKPTPISDKEVEAIQKFMKLEEPMYKVQFSVGEAVKITDGPFTEFLGTIESIDEARGKVKVLVSIFGRETPVELDFLQVKKI